MGVRLSWFRWRPGAPRRSRHYGGMKCTKRPQEHILWGSLGNSAGSFSEVKVKIAARIEIQVKWKGTLKALVRVGALLWAFLEAGQ